MSVASGGPSVAGFCMECPLVVNWARPLPMVYWEGVSPRAGGASGLEASWTAAVELQGHTGRIPQELS